MCKSKIQLKGMARITGLLLAAGCMAADLQAADIEWKSMMTVAERKRDAQGQLQPLQSGAPVGTVKSRTFNVLNYGAVGDDKTDNTAAFSA